MVIAAPFKKSRTFEPQHFLIPLVVYYVHVTFQGQTETIMR